MKKIARSEKIDESREFASDIQDSLAKRIQKQYKPVKDRGVRKAPFVVLIGADMPSILTEISFLSNPADEEKFNELLLTPGIIVADHLLEQGELLLLVHREVEPPLVKPHANNHSHQQYEHNQ